MTRHLVDRREVALGMKNGLEIPVPNICSFFGINRSTLFRWQAEAAAVTQEKEPRRAPASSKVTPERAAWLAKEALERVTVTQARLAKDFETRFGVPVTQQHVSTVLRRQGIVRKKVRYVSSEAAAQPERHIAFHEQILASEPANRAALDESGFYLNDGPRYGYARKGDEAVVERPLHRGTKTTLAVCISAVPRPGNYRGCVVSYIIHNGTTDNDRFVSFLRTVNSSESGAERAAAPLTVIADNAGFHGPPLLKRKARDGTVTYRDCSNTKSFKAVREVASANNLSLAYMRPQSPQFNPAEIFFAMTKHRVRADCPSTQEELIASIKRAVDAVADMDLSKIFHHCFKASAAEYTRLVAAEGLLSLGTLPVPSSDVRLVAAAADFAGPERHADADTAPISGSLAPTLASQCPCVASPFFHAAAVVGICDSFRSLPRELDLAWLVTDVIKLGRNPWMGRFRRALIDAHIAPDGNVLRRLALISEKHLDRFCSYLVEGKPVSSRPDKRSRAPQRIRFAVDCYRAFVLELPRAYCDERGYLLLGPHRTWASGQEESQGSRDIHQRQEGCVDSDPEVPDLNHLRVAFTHSLGPQLAAVLRDLCISYFAPAELDGMNSTETFDARLQALVRHLVAGGDEAWIEFCSDLVDAAAGYCAPAVRQFSLMSSEQLAASPEMQRTRCFIERLRYKWSDHWAADASGARTPPWASDGRYAAWPSLRAVLRLVRTSVGAKIAMVADRFVRAAALCGYSHDSGDPAVRFLSSLNERGRRQFEGYLRLPKSCRSGPRGAKLGPQLLAALWSTVERAAAAVDAPWGRRNVGSA